MADQADADDDLFELPEGEIEQEGETQDGAPEGETDEEETLVTFGEEGAPPSSEKDTGLVRKLRAEIRDRDARINALSKPKPVELGPKPTMEDCYEADDPEAEFEKRIIAWNEQKAKAGEADAQAQRDAEAEQSAFRQDLTRFATKRAELKVKDFADAEEEVVSALTKVQSAVLIKAADNSAAVIYALGKHPERLKRLAAISDPIKLAVAVSKLERELKVTTQRRAPAPEGTVRGSAPLSKGTDKQLERLEKQARETGDRTALRKYRQQQASKGNR